MKLDRGVLNSFPKVLLHEHLDGVLRPKTVIELARSAKYGQLPTEDPEGLARWFHQGANQGSLPKYLEGFAHSEGIEPPAGGLRRAEGFGAGPKRLWDFFGINHLRDAQYGRVARNGRTRR